jgi:MinD-like ATPase involved in chromosome partitioning or flagellar assembly
MRIAIVNLGGNQGKTTLAVNLFAPRMPGAKILAVETINAAGGDLGAEVEKLKGEQFSRIYAELAAADELILDVGASNIEDFLAGLSKFEDGHDEIDLFVVPVTESKKERQEAMKTAAMLGDLGVPGERVKFVFNRVTDPVESSFADVLDFAKKTKSAIANPDCVVPESDLFDLMATRKMNIADALLDTTDYKAALKDAKDDQKAFNKARDGLSIQKQSKALNRQLEYVFGLLTGSEA